MPNDQSGICRNDANYQLLTINQVATVGEREGKAVDNSAPDDGPKVTTEKEMTSAKRGSAEKSPELYDGEILPPGWQDAAEAHGLPDDVIFKSWRRFKEMTKHPMRRDAWKAWASKEIIPDRMAALKKRSGEEMDF